MHFSARLGVAEACCLPCVGYSYLFITPSPVVSVVGQSIQLYALAYYGNGILYDFTGSSTWSSSDTVVASVATGLVTGVTDGSATISASRSLYESGEKAFVSLAGAERLALRLTSLRLHAHAACKIAEFHSAPACPWPRKASYH